MIEDVLAVIVLVVLVFGGLAGCIVKYFIYRRKKTRQKMEEGKRDGYI